MTVMLIQPRETLIHRETIVRRLAVGIVAALAFAPGCGGSSSGHMADPAAAAKTLIGDDPAPSTSKPVANKKLRKLIEEEQKEIAKHPKIR